MITRLTQLGIGGRRYAPDAFAGKEPLEESSGIIDGGQVGFFFKRQEERKARFLKRTKRPNIKKELNTAIQEAEKHLPQIEIDSLRVAANSIDKALDNLLKIQEAVAIIDEIQKRVKKRRKKKLNLLLLATL